MLACLLLALAPGVCLGASPDVAAVPRLSLTPPRIDSPPHIDGQLDDPVWSGASPSAVASGFVQQRPATGQPAGQPTWVRVAYSAEALFLGFSCSEPDPRRIVRQELGRDSELWEDDYLAVVLDSFADRQNGYLFQVNPNGVRTDAQFRNEGRLLNTDWDGLWKAAVLVTDEGWQGEIEIPWRTLRFPVSERIAMGINFERQRRADNEQSHWSAVEREFDAFRMTDAGELAGLTGISPGSNLLGRPYALGRIERGSALAAGDDPSAAFAADDWTAHGDIGYDLRAGLTSSLTLDVTLNTDFAQVEVDDQVVNLTRFPLFFPEKREFFLEKRDFFQFGSPANLAFFSRRVGLEAVVGEGGVEALVIPIDYGTRLTGKLGRTDIGVLDIQAGSRGDVPRRRFDVARVSQDVGTRSRVGAIAVSRQSEDDDDFNRVFGVDTDWKPAERLDLSGYAALSDERGDGRDHGTWGGRARWTERLWNLTALHEVYGRDYTPRAGFLPRQDVETTALELGWTPEPNVGWLRRFENFVYYDYFARRDGGQESRSVFAQMTAFGAGNEQLALHFSHAFERLFEDFAVGGDVVFPAGSYDFAQAGGEFETDPSKPISAEVELVWGDFYDGTLASTSGEVSARWAPHVELAAQVRSDRVRRDGPQGDSQRSFDADVLRLRLGLDVTNELSFDLFTQLNSDEDLVLSQWRAHYLFGNESDVYLVLTDIRDDHSGDFAPRRGELVLKLSYAARF